MEFTFSLLIQSIPSYYWTQNLDTSWRYLSVLIWTFGQRYIYLSVLDYMGIWPEEILASPYIKYLIMEVEFWKFDQRFILFGSPYKDIWSKVNYSCQFLYEHLAKVWYAFEFLNRHLAKCKLIYIGSSWTFGQM